MGTCPDYYVLIQAAKYLECKPWELMEQSVVWRDWALKCMTAESNAQEILKSAGR